LEAAFLINDLRHQKRQNSQSALLGVPPVGTGQTENQRQINNDETDQGIF